MWNFSQPISDNMEEAVSGVKGELAVKIYGTDLKTLEQKGDEIVDVMSNDPRRRRPRPVPRHRPAQPQFHGRPRKADRYGINVSDVQDAIQTAVGGNAVTQVLQGEAALRPGGALSAAIPLHHRGDREHPPAGALRRTRLAGAACNITIDDGASEDLPRRQLSATSPSSTACAAATWAAPSKKPSQKVNAQVKLPPGYTLDWAGEYESQKRAARRLADRHSAHAAGDLLDPLLDVPLRQVGVLVLVNVAWRRVGGLLALCITGTNFSVSTGVGFLALFGVSVQTGVIMLEYINQLRARGHTMHEAALRGRSAACVPS